MWQAPFSQNLFILMIFLPITLRQKTSTQLWRYGRKKSISNSQRPIIVINIWTHTKVSQAQGKNFSSLLCWSLNRESKFCTSFIVSWCLISVKCVWIKDFISPSTVPLSCQHRNHQKQKFKEGKNSILIFFFAASTSNFVSNIVSFNSSCGF